MFIKISEDTLVNLDKIIVIEDHYAYLDVVVGYNPENGRYKLFAEGEYAEYIRKFFNTALGPKESK